MPSFSHGTKLTENFWCYFVLHSTWCLQHPINHENSETLNFSGPKLVAYYGTSSCLLVTLMQWPCHYKDLKPLREISWRIDLTSAFCFTYFLLLAKIYHSIAAAGKGFMRCWFVSITINIYKSSCPWRICDPFINPTMVLSGHRQNSQSVSLLSVISFGYTLEKGIC